jgi:hypothetical protein
MCVLDGFRSELERALRGNFPGIWHLFAECLVDNGAGDIEKRGGAKGECADPAR